MCSVHFLEWASYKLQLLPVRMATVVQLKSGRALPGCSVNLLTEMSSWAVLLQSLGQLLCHVRAELVEVDAEAYDIGLYLEMAPFQFPQLSLFSSFQSNQTLNSFI